MKGFITVQETASKWGITPRQVQILCKNGRIKGASRMSRIWISPESAEKPTKDKPSDASRHHIPNNLFTKDTGKRSARETISMMPMLRQCLFLTTGQ